MDGYRVDYTPAGRRRAEAYDPTRIHRVAMVEPTNLTPDDEAIVAIERPLTGALITGIRDRCDFELIPGHLAERRDFLVAVRAWLNRPRDNRFPSEPFATLVADNPADAYLLVWLDRAVRPWIVDPDRQRVPAQRLILDATAVLLYPDGRVAWRLSSSRNVPYPPNGLAQVARAQVHRFVDDVVGAFLTPPP